MEAAKSEEVNIRFNSPGGDVFRGWGAITKIKQHKKPVNGIVDGFAASMAGVMLPYLDKVTAVNVAWVMIHAASGGGRDENDQDAARMRQKVNEDLLKAFQNKVDETKFRDITGVSLEDLFLNPAFANKDVWLTAEQAEEINLIDEVLDINAEEFTAHEKNFTAFNKNVLFLNQQSRKDDEKNINSENQKPEKMTKAELKDKHPEVYNAIYNEGVESGIEKGVNQERDRVTAFANFVEADSEGVVKSIKDGDEFNNAALSDLTQKALKKGVEASAEDESPEDGATDSPQAEANSDNSEGAEQSETNADTEKAENMKNFLAQVDENLKN